MSYRDCIQRHSRGVAQALWRLGLENQRLLEAQIAEYEIDCDYEVAGMTFLVRRDVEASQERLDAYRADHELLREDGFAVDLLDGPEARAAGGSPLYVGGLRYRSDAQFHSGRFVIGLAVGVARHPKVRIYEGCRVRSIERQGAATRVASCAGNVTAPVVFLATNALVPQYVPALTRALRAERGQVLVTEVLPARPCRGSFGTNLAWWREIRDPRGGYRLLFGGGRTRDEPDSLFPQYRADGTPHPQLEAEGFSSSADHQRRLDEQFALLFPEIAHARVTHRWGGLQSFTRDDLPVVGLLDPERNIWGMAGFCGRGNGHSDVAAEFLAGRVAGAASEVEKRFGSLFDTLLRVGRDSANWGPWHSCYD